MQKRWLILSLMVLLFSACNSGSNHKAEVESLPQEDSASLFINDSSLIVATLSRSTSFFSIRGENMGYEYELAERFAKSLNRKLYVVTAKDMNNLVQMLEDKEVDLIAYPLSITNEFKGRVKFTEHEYITKQVLVQKNSKKNTPVKDVTELIGKEIVVVENSKYHERLKNLNDEIGGGIKITVVDNEEDEEKLIEKVSKGEIEYTIADDNIAKINKTYYNNINISVPISFEQRSAWAVALANDELHNAVNKWFGESKNNYIYHYLYNKYFEKKRANSNEVPLYLNKYKISEYDHFFKKNAKTIGWDWRLLASMAYQESRFNPDAVSWAGAMGLMQIMPATAKNLGADSLAIKNAETNIELAVVYLQKSEKYFTKIEDPAERIKFLLASYNAGAGHIQDAMALAEKFGKDPYKWDDNVDKFILRKSNPDYFDDPVVKHGYLRGHETYNYVKEILIRYQEYKLKIKK
ncbi:MAG: transporter substrate-binding domain-containing protein [Paludibacteraceae bacterium]|nr:transporter substrate-binding domain-containing protein [Paludibacteraceae bacterium]MBO5988649.1 transporter substrate-binding domain-containing protein [Paludibacteraceae bacterium]MEE0997569.1 transporter substrate-binding domain-containing protein [Paludibacteraceae bacterium]